MSRSYSSGFGPADSLIVCSNDVSIPEAKAAVLDSSMGTLTATRKSSYPRPARESGRVEACVGAEQIEIAATERGKDGWGGNLPFPRVLVAASAGGREQADLFDRAEVGQAREGGLLRFLESGHHLGGEARQ